MDRISANETPIVSGALTPVTAWISEPALAELRALADRAFPLETGGLLLGYQTHQEILVITQIVGPGPKAVHRDHGFEPDTPWQAAELARRYEAADRHLDYLGDWHTHPRGSATLSRRDRRTLSRIGRDPAARCPHPMMVLLFGENPWRVAAFRSNGGRFLPSLAGPFLLATYRPA